VYAPWRVCTDWTPDGQRDFWQQLKPNVLRGWTGVGNWCSVYSIPTTAVRNAVGSYTFRRIVFIDVCAEAARNVIALVVSPKISPGAGTRSVATRKTRAAGRGAAASRPEPGPGASRRQRAELASWQLAS